MISSKEEDEKKEGEEVVSNNNLLEIAHESEHQSLHRSGTPLSQSAGKKSKQSPKEDSIHSQ